MQGILVGKRKRTQAYVQTVCWLTLWLTALGAGGDPFPAYKPSSRSPAPIDIRLNEYGASRSAPEALEIGALAPDFAAPRAGGGIVTSRTLRRNGPVVLIFYRGHW